MLNGEIITNVSDDGEVADSLDNYHPPIDGIGLYRQDALFEINDFIL
jgi:hypothetical protein